MPLTRPAERMGLWGILHNDEAVPLPSPGCAIIRIRKPLQLELPLAVFDRKGTTALLDSVVGSRTDRD